MSHKIKLVDPECRLVATAVVQNNGSYYADTIDTREMPPILLRLYEEWESLVNDQVFGRLDEIEDELQKTPLAVLFDDGRRVAAADVQVFPKAGTVTFKVA